MASGLSRADQPLKLFNEGNVRINFFPLGWREVINQESGHRSVDFVKMFLAKASSRKTPLKITP